jgi:hypothetical protein
MRVGRRRSARKERRLCRARVRDASRPLDCGRFVEWDLQCEASVREIEPHRVVRF